MITLSVSIKEAPKRYKMIVEWHPEIECCLYADFCERIVVKNTITGVEYCFKYSNKINRFLYIFLDMTLVFSFLKYFCDSYDRCYKNDVYIGKIDVSGLYKFEPIEFTINDADYQAVLHDDHYISVVKDNKQFMLMHAEKDKVYKTYRYIADYDTTNEDFMFIIALMVLLGVSVFSPRIDRKFPWSPPKSLDYLYYPERAGWHSPQIGADMK